MGKRVPPWRVNGGGNGMSLAGELAVSRQLAYGAALAGWIPTEDSTVAKFYRCAQRLMTKVSARGAGVDSG
jgi:hypothetical protein